MSRFFYAGVAGALLTGCASSPEPIDMLLLFGLLAVRAVTQQSGSFRHHLQH